MICGAEVEGSAGETGRQRTIVRRAVLMFEAKGRKEAGECSRIALVVSMKSTFYQRDRAEFKAFLTRSFQSD